MLGVALHLSIFSIEGFGERIMKIIFIGLTLILSGCSTNTYWQHKTGNNSSFTQDDYECEKETQPRSVSVSGAYGSSRVMQNMYLWKLCMKSRGYKQTK